jgi:hypothetical protein
MPQLAPSTLHVYEGIEQRALTPRIKMGLRLYALNAVRTLTEAAEVAECSLQYLSMMKNSPAGQAYMMELTGKVDDSGVATSEIISRLGRKAIGILGNMMEDSPSEAIRLRAAIDLADRAPETSKVQKVQLESFTLGNKSAQEIAAAIVQGSSVHTKYAHLAEGNFDRVGMEESKE